jgi:hypothetical protein
MAEADGNRTRRGRVATPPTGFEVRAGHQPQKRFHEIAVNSRRRCLIARHCGLRQSSDWQSLEHLLAAQPSGKRRCRESVRIFRLNRATLCNLMSP